MYIPVEYHIRPCKVRECPGYMGQMCGLHKELSGLHGEMPGLYGEISGLYKELSGLYGELSDGELSGLYREMSGLYGELSGLYLLFYLLFYKCVYLYTRCTKVRRSYKSRSSIGDFWIQSMEAQLLLVLAAVCVSSKHVLTRHKYDDETHLYTNSKHALTAAESIG